MTRFITLTGTGSLITATVTTEDALALLRRAALDKQPVSGLTHRFYRYPARFSPIFARACIEAFSKPGDLVLDPYMGGGTTVVEAMALGRQAVGSDINSLSVFVAQAKSSRLTQNERRAIHRWATCPRRLNFDHLCRLNFDQGSGAVRLTVGCG